MLTDSVPQTMRTPKTPSPHSAAFGPATNSGSLTPSNSATHKVPSANTHDFTFPTTYSFPPFFTLQPNTTTRHSQFQKWSTLIQSYCRHYRLYRLSLIDAVEYPLFHNAQIRKRLSLADARTVVDWMTSPEGGRRAEWVGGESSGKATAWIWWRRPEEWADLLVNWVSSGSKSFSFPQEACPSLMCRINPSI